MSSYTLPALPYAYDALEPHIDARTMEIHHGKHHQAYVNNLNAALEGTSHAGRSVESLVAAIGELPEALQTAVRNNGGGHANHSLKIHHATSASMISDISHHAGWTKVSIR